MTSQSLGVASANHQISSFSSVSLLARPLSLSLSLSLSLVSLSLRTAPVLSSGLGFRV